MDIRLPKAINIRDVKALPPGVCWRVTEKVDGVGRYFYKNARGKVRAYHPRTNTEDKWLTHITDFLERPEFPVGYIYNTDLVDREAYLTNVDCFELRTISVGKAAQQYARNKKDLMAVCFDVFEPDGSMTDGRSRDALLRELFAHSPLSSPVVMVPQLGTIKSSDKDILSGLMRTVEMKGGEGLVLMDLDSIHIPGRSKTLIKVKRFIEVFGEVVDYEVGAPGTKIHGGVSVLICRVDGCTVPVRVGSGFTKEERTSFLTIGKRLIGANVELDAFGRTANANGTVSLSMPIFKRLLMN